MAETNLIGIPDVQTYRKIDPKFNIDRFNGFEQELRRKNLRRLLGESLYYAFMDDDRVSGIYSDLLNGKKYTVNNQTIEYYGMKPYLSYLWLSIACREGDLFMSTYGAVGFTNNPQQHFESSKIKDQMVKEYTQTAQDYANDIIKFLNNNSSLYPLWVTDTETKPMKFFTFKI